MTIEEVVWWSSYFEAAILALSHIVVLHRAVVGCKYHDIGNVYDCIDNVVDDLDNIFADW
jgi:hypothetical protein